MIKSYNLVPISHMVGYGFESENIRQKQSRNELLKNEYLEFLKSQQFYNDFKSVLKYFSTVGLSILPFGLSYMFGNKDSQLLLNLSKIVLKDKIKSTETAEIGTNTDMIGGGAKKNNSWAPYIASWLALGAIPFAIDAYTGNFSQPPVFRSVEDFGVNF